MTVIEWVGIAVSTLAFIGVFALGVVLVMAAWEWALNKTVLIFKLNLEAYHFIRLKLSKDGSLITEYTRLLERERARSDRDDDLYARMRAAEHKAHRAQLRWLAAWRRARGES